MRTSNSGSQVGSESPDTIAVGNHELISSQRRELLWPNTLAAKIAEAPAEDPGRHGLREASASIPPMKCRELIGRCQNRGPILPSKRAAQSDTKRKAPRRRRTLLLIPGTNLIFAIRLPQSC